MSIIRFNDILPLQMRHILTDYMPDDYYISEPIERLRKYDRDHGTFLCRTLAVSLFNNMSPSLSAKTLFLSRTAYLYRMERIREITGYQLEDYRTRLYLMNLFDILENGQGLQHL